MVHGLPQIDHANQIYDSCLAWKQRRAPFPQQEKTRAEGLLVLVHGDICGPITSAIPAGRSYFQLLLDDLSRYMWLTLLMTKDQVAMAIKRFRAGAEVETAETPAAPYDRGGEFIIATFAEYCAEEGIGRKLM